MTLKSDIQQLDPGHLIELYSLDCTELGGDVLRFHAHLQSGTILWQGNTYSPWPVTSEGFERTGNASQPTPTLTVANVDGSMSALCISLSDLVGSKVTRHRTLAQYLDGQPGADSTQFIPDVWYVDQKSSEDDTQVQFTLASVLDMSGRQLPARQVVANLCQWIYKDPTTCQWSGTTYYDKDNNQVSDASSDVCGKRLSSCKCRWGATAPLTFGGFPSAGTAGTL